MTSVDISSHRYVTGKQRQNWNSQTEHLWGPGL